MHRVAFVAVVSLGLLVGCSKEHTNFTVETRDGVPHAVNRGTNVWSDSAAAPLQFTREQTYGTNEGSGPALLGGIAGLAVDSTGTVYVLDRENHRLVAFNPDGTVQWSAGRQGFGPGEFQLPHGLIVTDRHLYVGNDNSRQIDVWTTDGSFVERHALAESDIGSFTLVGLAEGRLIVSETTSGARPQRLHVLDTTTWRIGRSFPVKSKPELPPKQGLSSAVTTIDGEIYVPSLTDYTFRRYSADGTLTRVISRSIDFIVPPGVHTSGGSSHMQVYSALSPPLQLTDKWYLVEASAPTNVDDPDGHAKRVLNDAAKERTYATLVDLFESTGRYVGSLRWEGRTSPPMGDLEIVGPRHKLYTRSDHPFPQVRRYDVTIEDR